MHLLFKTPSKRSLDYNVVIQIFSDMPKKKQNQLEYDCSVSLDKNTTKGYVLSIKKSNILLNDMVDHSPINEILLIAEEFLSELKLEISESGKIVKIVNLNEIQDKAKSIRLKIESAYKGDLVYRILHPMLQKLESEDKIIKSLDKDPLLFYLMKGIYGVYEQGQASFNGTLWGISTSQVKVRKSNKLLINEEGKPLINFKIFVDSEDRTHLEKQLREEFGEGVLEMKMEGNYIFSSSHYLESLQVDQTIYWNEEIYKSLKLDLRSKPE